MLWLFILSIYVFIEEQKAQSEHSADGDEVGLLTEGGDLYLTFRIRNNFFVKAMETLNLCSCISTPEHFETSTQSSTLITVP